MQYGVEATDLVTDDYISFKAVGMKGSMNGYLGQLKQQMGRIDTQSLILLYHLIEMMLENDDVARYVFNQPAPTISHARYTDFFWSYCEQLKITIHNQSKNTGSMPDYQQKRLDLVMQVLGQRESLDAKLAPWIQDQKNKLENMGEEEFAGFSKQSLHAQAPEVITSYPPAYLVGALDTEASRVVLTQETEKVAVVLEEFPAEYMYSNPQGLFNLSVPDK